MQDAGLSSAVSGGGVSQQAEPLSADIEQLDADNAPQSVSTALAESSSNDENEYDGVGQLPHARCRPSLPEALQPLTAAHPRPLCSASPQSLSRRRMRAEQSPLLRSLRAACQQLRVRTRRRRRRAAGRAAAPELAAPSATERR